MQLPWVTLPEDKRFDVINSVGDALVSGKRRRDEKERYAAEQLRLKEKDKGEAEMRAAQIENYKSEAEQRKHQQEMQDAEQHMKVAGMIQKSLDAGKTDEANLIAKQYKMPIARQAAAVSQMPGNTVMPPTGVDFNAPPEDGQSTSDVMAKNSAALAANAPNKPKEPGWMIGGQAYDPAQTEAAADAEREKEAQRVEGAYKPVGFDKTAGALVRGNTGKPAEVDQAYIAQKKLEEAQAQKEALLGMRNDFTQQRDERNKMDVATQLSEAAKNRAARIQAAKAQGGNARQDTANLGAYKYVDQVTKEGAKELGLPKLNENLSTIDLALQEMQKPSGAAQIGGRMALERALRGGPPTQYMDQMEANHLGGLWSRLEGALTTAGTGEMSPGQIQAIVQEGQAAKEALSAARERRLSAIKGRLQRDPALQNMRGTVNERYKQVAEGMGAPAEDIFPGENNSLPAVGANSVANKPKPTVGDKLKAAGKKKTGGEDDTARKRRLLMELSGGG